MAVAIKQNVTSRPDFLRNQAERCKRLALALPACAARAELERLALQYQSELDAFESRALGRSE